MCYTKSSPVLALFPLNFLLFLSSPSEPPYFPLAPLPPCRSDFCVIPGHRYRSLLSHSRLRQIQPQPHPSPPQEWSLADFTGTVWDPPTQETAKDFTTAHDLQLRFFHHLNLTFLPVLFGSGSCKPRGAGKRVTLQERDQNGARGKHTV